MGNASLYKALIEAKVSENTAEKAANGVATIEHVAEKSEFVRLATDVKHLTTNVATKIDLKEATKDVVTKDDLKEAIKDMATKTDIKVAVTESEVRQMRFAVLVAGFVIAAVTLLDKFF